MLNSFLRHNVLYYSDDMLNYEQTSKEPIELLREMQNKIIKLKLK